MCRRGQRRVFNVAIRTAHLDREQERLEFGVGGGIVWQSSAVEEYAECLVKAEVLRARPQPSFELLETLLYEEGAYFLLERHLERLAQSAAYWGFCYADDRVRAQLQDATKAMEGRRRVRLLLDRNGAVRVQCYELTPPRRLRVALAAEPVDSADSLLYHKTTHRAMYDRQLAARPDCDDVVLHNERGELTECCIGNLVLERDGVRYTPPGRSRAVGRYVPRRIVGAGRAKGTGRCWSRTWRKPTRSISSIPCGAGLNWNWSESHGPSSNQAMTHTYTLLPF